MAKKTKIAWTHHTFNGWIGCSKVDEGCTNCYAEADQDHFRHRAKWGPSGMRTRTTDSYWKQPLKWNRDAEAARERRRVFCGSLKDIFEDWQGSILDSNEKRLWVPRTGGRIYCGESQQFSIEDCRPATMDDLRQDLFDLIDRTPWLDWLLLTKRPQNIWRMWPGLDFGESIFAPTSFERGSPSKKRRENVALGASVSNQPTADRKLPDLLKCHRLCPVLFVSAEPLLGTIDFRSIADDGHNAINALTGNRLVNDEVREGSRLDWIIVGGESGKGFRPMELDWARDIRDQCRTAGVAFFFKQSAARKSETGIELDGEIIREFPDRGRISLV